jgi:hypothetical protein
VGFVPVDGRLLGSSFTPLASGTYDPSHYDTRGQPGAYTVNVTAVTGGDYLGSPAATGALTLSTAPPNTAPTGPDSLAGTASPDTINGTADDDMLVGTDATASGLPYAVLLRGDAGSDTIGGRQSTLNLVSHADSPVGVTASLQLPKDSAGSRSGTAKDAFSATWADTPINVQRSKARPLPMP